MTTTTNRIRNCIDLNLSESQSNSLKGTSFIQKKLLFDGSSYQENQYTYIALKPITKEIFIQIIGEISDAYRLGSELKLDASQIAHYNEEVENNKENSNPIEENPLPPDLHNKIVRLQALFKEHQICNINGYVPEFIEQDIHQRLGLSLIPSN